MNRKLRFLAPLLLAVGAASCSDNGSTVGEGSSNGTACTTASDCPGTACATPSCTANICGTTDADKGISCSDNGGTVCDGSGNCVECVKTSDCPATGTMCATPSCTANICGTTDADKGISCSDNDGTVCDGSGNCVECVKTSDCPATGVVCVTPTCAANACDLTDTAAGTPCSDLGGTVCDGSGNCVECVKTSDCLATGTLCATPTCTSFNTCDTTDATVGTACNDGGGTVCDGLGTCVAATCFDGVKDGDETGVDCGGPTCHACPDGQGCLLPSDCTSGDCKSMVCTACALDTDCAAAQLFCDLTNHGGTCTPRKPLGAPCTVVDACTSGNCVDGVCCSSACTGTCQACTAALTGQPDGMCASIGAGAPAPSGQCLKSLPCGNDGKCGAGGMCELFSSGTPCGGNASCAAGSVTPAPTCDGAGTCTAAAPVSCSPYANCNVGGTGCATSCMQDNDCTIGPCNICPPAAQLCLAPLAPLAPLTAAGVTCQLPLAPCQPANPPTCGPLLPFRYVGIAPQTIAFDGEDMWVPNGGNVGFASEQVTELSPTGMTLTQALVAGALGGIAFDGSNMWVVSQGSFPAPGFVTELLPNGMPMGTFPVGTNPQAIAFDGMNMWVANGGDGTVTKLLASNGMPLGTYAVGHGPNAIAFDGMNMWVAGSDGTVTKLLASNGMPLGTFTVGSYANGIAFDGTNMWVANCVSNNITVLSPTGTLANLAGNPNPVTVGTCPSAIAFDGTNMWVANHGGNNVLGTVTELLASNGATVGTFGAEGFPVGIAFDGAHMWVVNQGGNSVEEF